MAPRPSPYDAKSFPSLLSSLRSDSNILISEYELHRMEAQKEFFSLKADYPADTVLSTLAKEDQRWRDYIKWRLVELWRIGTDEDTIVVLLHDEMKDDLGILDDTGDLFLISLKSWYENRYTSSSLSRSVPSPPTARPDPAPPLTLLQQLQDELATYLQQFRSALRLPIKWFFRILFHIGVIYFLFNCLMFLLKEIPIIGPTVIYLINQIDALIPAEPPTPKPFTWLLNFNISNNFFVRKVVFPVVSLFASPSASNNSLVEVAEVLVSEPLFDAMRDAKNLTQISLRLLPVSKILEYSSYSLMSAYAIVRASDLECKEQLEEYYGRLLGDTRTLGMSLADFDIGVQALTMNFGFQLKMALERIHEIMAASSARYVNPLWDMITHTATLTSSACSALPVLYDLSLWTSITCSVSFFLSAQGHCYLLSKAAVDMTPARNPLLHTVCAPIRYFNPTSSSDLEKALLHLEAQMLADEFSSLVLATSTKIGSLVAKGEESRQNATIIQECYLNITVLQRKSEKHVLGNQSSLNFKAHATRSWPEFFAGRRQGLQDEEKDDVIRLDDQLRDLKELEPIQRDADFYLKAVIDVLMDMQKNLDRFRFRVEDFKAIQQKHNGLRILLNEMERLEPLIASLYDLNVEHGAERQRMTDMWREKWDHCVRLRSLGQGKEVGKGWEDCLFQP